MNFYGENARGCICVPLSNRRADLVALHHEVLRALYAAGYDDVPARFAHIEKNGTVTAYAWRDATYGVLRLVRHGGSGAWQIEIRGDFSKPFPEQNIRTTRQHGRRKKH